MLAAVLALVIERPSYGYELGHRFDERFGELYPISQSRIYQLLDRLRTLGLAEEIPDDSERASLRQPRPHYRATAAGARRHRQWIAAAIQADPRREELLRRLLATSAHDARTMLQIVDSYERACLDDMAHRSTRSVHRSDDEPSERKRLRDVLISEERRLAHEGRLKFIAFARRHIQAEIDSRDDRG
ncbi:MAG: PadR family transcriptional regulator [Thermoleophilaceae bacterium]